ncbi:hypothetical protein [Methylibium sp. T29]|uniref:hypothetical protein n=1 Tax=Methylibium sp. T29 TaxID=1430884 RepID=UPI0031B9D693
MLFEDDLHAALAIIDRPEVLQQEVSGFPAFELGAACNVLSFGRIAAGDFEGARKSLMQARAHSERGAGSFVMGYTSAVSGARLIVQGKLDEAIERYRADMLAQHAPLDKSFAPAVMAAAQIWALYEANDLAALEPLCAQFQRGISECVTLDFIALAYLSISRMHDARGRSAEAQEVLDELERMGHDSHLDRLVSQADWERVRRAVLAGELDRATALAQRIAPVCPPLDPHWIYMADDMEGEGFGRIRLAIAHHDHALASQLIARERARQTGRVYRDIRLHMFEALLLNDKGSPNGAHRSCARRCSWRGRAATCAASSTRAAPSSRCCGRSTSTFCSPPTRARRRPIRTATSSNCCWPRRAPTSASRAAGTTSPTRCRSARRRCCSSWPTAWPTRRSPRGCSSPRTPSSST